MTGDPTFASTTLPTIPILDSPTLPPDSVAPLNDLCEGAIALEIGDEFTGSTALAFFDATFDCGEAFGGNRSAPGIWCQVVGEGTTLQVDVTAAFDMQISIFTGPDCDSLVCIDGTAGEPPTYTSGNVAWDAIEGETYYILVHGFEQQVGTFDLTLTETTRPTNDQCESATTLNLDSPLNQTTALASIDDVEICGTTSGGILSAPGLWYSVTGTGGAKVVNVESDFNVQVSIYTGENCDSLVCVDGRAGKDPRLTSVTLVWDSKGATDYWILVHGFNQDTGNFQVVVSEVERPSNDVCSSAIEMKLGDTVAGSTNHSSLDVITDSCGSANNNSAPGVWYYFRGAGNDTIKAIFVTGFDAQLSVFGGSDCSSLVCIDGSDGDSPLYTSGSVTWASQAGEVYYLLLHGFNMVVGDFELTLTEGSTAGTVVPSAGPAPSNDACQNAIAIGNGQTINGSTVLASRDETVYASENCGEYVSLNFFHSLCTHARYHLIRYPFACTL
jgi:hypothetical protein